MHVSHKNSFWPLESPVVIRVQNHVSKWTGGHPRDGLGGDTGKPRMGRKGVAEKVQKASTCWSANLESGDIFLGEKGGHYEKMITRMEGYSTSTHVQAKADLHHQSTFKKIFN